MTRALVVSGLLLLFTSKAFGWTPSIRYISIFDDPIGNLKQMWMPAFAIAAPKVTVGRAAPASAGATRHSSASVVAVGIPGRTAGPTARAVAVAQTSGALVVVVAEP